VRPDEIGDLSNAQCRWEAGVLWRDTDGASRSGSPRIRPEELRPADIRSAETEHQRERRRLACAVRAEERQYLAFVELEIDLIERDHGAESLGHAPEGSGNHGLRLRTRTRSAWTAQSTSRL
jgi:hypothetical protein